MDSTKRLIYPLLAKVGHKLPGDHAEQAKALWEHYKDEGIETYEMNRLSTLQDILDQKSSISDLVMLSETRKFSLDYDYKRNLDSEGYTTPHQTMDDFLKYRGVVNNLRDNKKQRATPDQVDIYYTRAKQHVRLSGSNRDDCVRHFIRALVQGVHPFSIHRVSYVDVSKTLRDFDVTISKLKNAKRAPFVANVVFNNSANRSCIRRMLKALGYESDNNYKEWIDLLVHKGLSNPVTMFD